MGIPLGAFCCQNSPYLPPSYWGGVLHLAGNLVPYPGRALDRCLVAGLNIGVVGKRITDIDDDWLVDAFRIRNLG